MTLATGDKLMRVKRGWLRRAETVYVKAAELRADLASDGADRAVVDRVNAVAAAADQLCRDLEALCESRSLGRAAAPGNAVRGDGGCLHCEADQGEEHRPHCARPVR
jgi:hypothetical protein